MKMTHKQKQHAQRKRSMLDDLNAGLYELAGHLAEYATLLREDEASREGEGRHSALT
jgi:hypothetical protein